MGDAGIKLARVIIEANSAGVSAVSSIGELLRDAVDEQLQWFAFIAGDAVLFIAAEGFLFDFHSFLLKSFCMFGWQFVAAISVWYQV